MRRNRPTLPRRLRLRMIGVQIAGNRRCRFTDARIRRHLGKRLDTVQPIGGRNHRQTQNREKNEAEHKLIFKVPWRGEKVRGCCWEQILTLGTCWAADRAARIARRSHEREWLVGGAIALTTRLKDDQMKEAKRAAKCGGKD